MRKLVYNLEFPSHCPKLDIFGYHFSRVEDYNEKVLKLQHRITSFSEFQINKTSGTHEITAYVDIPESELEAVLEWGSSGHTALNDVLLLLSMSTGRDVFAIDELEDDYVVIADPREYPWGGHLQISIHNPFERWDQTSEYSPCNIRFEKNLNSVYELIRSDKWQRKYQGGYFLFLTKQSFQAWSLESAFLQCWTIWEHLFAILNKKWLSEDQIRDLGSFEKISFLLVEFALREEIDKATKKRIKTLSKIRNRLVHFGRFPDDGSARNRSIRDDAILFVRLTDFIITKIMDLETNDAFNTLDHLEAFLQTTS
ncbi:MAG: hypothetical protein ACYDGX_04980 [Thermoleophilia bacterium]